MHGASGATGGKKKTDKRYLAVTPPKPYEVMRINAPDASENPGTHFNQQLTRRALLRDAELTPRDLRRIDPSLLQTNNTPALLVKDQTIMVNLGVRVIIRPDHALLFEPDTDTAQTVPARRGHQRTARGVLAGADAAGTSRRRKTGAQDFGADAGRCTARINEDLTKITISTRRRAGRGARPIPFELEMVEAALQETMSQLYAKLEFCEERCRQCPRAAPASINPAVLEELRLTKQSLVALDSRAGAVRQVLLDTLDDDEDIADFTISSTATRRGGQGGRGGGGGEPDRVLPAADRDGAQRRRAAAGEHARPRGVHLVSLSLAEVRGEQARTHPLHRHVRRGARGAGHGDLRHEPSVVPGDESITAFYLTCFLIVGGIGAIFQSIMKFARRQKIL